MLRIILSAMLLSSCCATPDQAKLPLPPKQTYPTIKAEELSCLSDKAYEALVVRKTMCESRIETLRNIIKKTH